MGLLDFLKHEPSARLIFGKRELQIIRKQLMGEQLKQSERNRLSKFIRPKLRFINSCSKYGEEFELKRRNVLKSLVEKAKLAILADKVGKKAKAILLFGSRVSGYTNFRSDIDICVLFEDISKEEAFRFQLRVPSKLPEIVDIRVFNTLPIWIRLEIAREHKILYKARGFDEDFWIYTIKEASESRVMHYVPT